MVYTDTTGGMMTNKNCIRCDVKLIPEVNWAGSRVIRRDYVCRPCYNEGNNNKERMWVNGKYIAKSHPLHKPGRYKTFSDAAFDGTYKLESIKEGYVYAITNPAWPEWVKIGMAIDADDRCNGYQTSSPFRDYTLEHMVVTNNRRVAEAQAHKAAAKIAEEQRGEWFKLDIEQAKTIIDKCSVVDQSLPTSSSTSLRYVA
jgi:hypothetical protein